MKQSIHRTIKILSKKLPFCCTYPYMNLGNFQGKGIKIGLSLLVFQQHSELFSMKKISIKKKKRLFLLKYFCMEILWDSLIIDYESFDLKTFFCFIFVWGQVWNYIKGEEGSQTAQMWWNLCLYCYACLRTANL